jgi:hypothetical protein
MKHAVVSIIIGMCCLTALPDAFGAELPPYVKLNGGARVWFSRIGGDLIQPNHTKLGLAENLGICTEKVVWDFFGSLRLDNVHVLRLRGETGTTYDQSKNDSTLKTWTIQASYDLDFYMTPQFLLGSQTGVALVCLDTFVNNVTVGNTIYNYQEKVQKVVPSLGFHGIFYPIIGGIAIRPSVSARMNWWNYESLELRDWEVAGSFDVPLNAYWTWIMGGGYRACNLGFKREKDRVDINRTGFFLEATLMF